MVALKYNKWKCVMIRFSIINNNLSVSAGGRILSSLKDKHVDICSWGLTLPLIDHITYITLQLSLYNPFLQLKLGAKLSWWLLACNFFFFLQKLMSILRACVISSPLKSSEWRKFPWTTSHHEDQKYNFFILGPFKCLFCKYAQLH